MALNDLDDETWKQVEEAFNTYGVVVAHEQFLTLDEQLALGARFGELFTSDGSSFPGIPGNGNPNNGPFAPVVGNVDREGKHHTSGEDPYVRRGSNNNVWHSDSTYQRPGATASILAGLEVPTGGGGETEFADMRAAYDALPAEVGKRLAGLRAWHSLSYSRIALGAWDGELPEDLTTLPGAAHSLVRVHPVTGRRSLVIGSHVAHIYGMDDDEGQRLAKELVDDACRPPRIYAHRWRQGDVVIWDNRSVLHRGRPYDYSERRRLQHVRAMGDTDF